MYSLLYLVAQLSTWSQINPDLSIAIGAIQVLTSVVETCSAKTLHGLQIELKAASDALRSYRNANISVSASCELFARFVTRTNSESNDFKQAKARVVERGARFAESSMAYRGAIARLCFRYISYYYLHMYIPVILY